MGLRLGTVVNQLRYPYLVRGGQRTIVTRNQRPDSWALLPEDVYLRLSEWKDCLVLTLNARPEVISPADGERLLRGFEALLLGQAAAGAPAHCSQVAALAGFTPRPVATTRRAVVGTSLVDLDRTGAELAGHPAVALARVFAEDHPAGGTRLTGYLTPTGPAPTEAQPTKPKEPGVDPR